MSLFAGGLISVCVCVGGGGEGVKINASDMTDIIRQNENLYLKK